MSIGYRAYSLTLIESLKTITDMCGEWQSEYKKCMQHADNERRKLGDQRALIQRRSDEWQRKQREETKSYHEEVDQFNKSIQEYQIKLDKERRLRTQAQQKVEHLSLMVAKYESECQLYKKQAESKDAELKLVLKQRKSMQLRIIELDGQLQELNDKKNEYVL